MVKQTRMDSILWTEAIGILRPEKTPSLRCGARKTMLAKQITKLLALVMLLCATQAFAQPPQPNTQQPKEQQPNEQPSAGRRPGPRPGERDPFFEAIRDAHRRQAAIREIFDLLRHESVQTEIQLSSEKLMEIQEVFRNSFNSIFELRNELKDSTESKEALVEKILQRQIPFDQKVFSLLRENAKYDRLLGIYVQAREYRAAANEDVASRIGLVGDDLQAFRTARSDIWHRLMDDNRDKIGNLIREGKRDEISELFEDAEKRLNEALAMKLTSEQRKALHDLEGQKFELPNRPFDFRGPPPHGGGGRRGEEPRPKDNCCNPKSLPVAAQRS